MRLLVDTGATHTLISREILELIGLPPSSSDRRMRVTTASSNEFLPVIEIKVFHCLGQQVEKMNILAHSIPFGSHVNGLLGMDFLSGFPFEIRPSIYQIKVR